MALGWLIGGQPFTSEGIEGEGGRDTEGVSGHRGNLAAPVQSGAWVRTRAAGILGLGGPCPASHPLGCRNAWLRPASEGWHRAGENELGALPRRADQRGTQKAQTDHEGAAGDKLCP